jgi:hypothetical protein
MMPGYIWAPKDVADVCYFIAEENGWQLRPSLADGEWKRVDALFEQVSAKLKETLIIVLLIEESINRTGEAPI